jgi:ribosomal protein L11 methyltransferase
VIVPAWLDHAGAPGEVVVRLDPDRAFGSGNHPTTRLTLELAAPLLKGGARVLDVGSGSGVLSIAAALSEAEVVAIDVDPHALETTRANVARNHLDDRVTVDPRPLADVVADPAAGRFDVVLANLLAPVVRELAPHLTVALAPQGRLIVSGLLEDRWRDAVDALTRPGRLEVAHVASRDGWVAVVLGPTAHRARAGTSPG